MHLHSIHMHIRRYILTYNLHPFIIGSKADRDRDSR